MCLPRVYLPRVSHWPRASRSAAIALSAVLNQSGPFWIGASAVTAALIIFGSVNAGKRHYEMATEALRAADHDWLARLVTRRVPMADWPKALEYLVKAGDQAVEAYANEEALDYYARALSALSGYL